MTQKLPSFNSRQVVSILKKRGFALDRQSGSHAIFIHPDGRRTTIPIHGKRDLGRGLLKQIMMDAELTLMTWLREEADVSAHGLGIGVRHVCNSAWAVAKSDSAPLSIYPSHPVG